MGGVGVQPVAQFGGGRKAPQHLQRGAGDGRRQAVGKEIGARLLAQHVDDFPARRGEAAHRAAERLAQRAGDDVDAAHHAVVLVRAASGRAHEAGGVRVVDHHQRAVTVGQIADLVQLGDRAVHREHAVGDDQLVPLAGGVLQLRFEVGHVIVRVAVALGLAQADAVDDRGVVQRVRDDRVVLVEQRLEHAAVGVEGRRVEDGVLHAEELGERLFQLLVHRLRAADEAYRRQAVAVLRDGLARRLDQRFVAGQAEVVVGAHVDQLPPVVAGDRAALARGQHALLLVQALRAQCVEVLPQAGVKGVLRHGVSRRLAVAADVC